MSMSPGDFLSAIEPYRDEIYCAIIEVGDCGPFDGGCVVFAQALQRVIGGDIVVLTRSNGQGDHAAVEYCGQLYDADGPLPPAEFIERFARNEFANVTGYRMMHPGDLREAVRDSSLEDRLVGIFCEALSHVQAENSWTCDRVRGFI